MMWEVIVLLSLVAADILFTYNLLWRTKQSGKKNWQELEANPVIRSFIKKYGLHKGIRLGAFYALAVISATLVYFKWRLQPAGFSNVVFFFMGAYVLLNIVHLSSLAYLVKMEKKK